MFCSNVFGDVDTARYPHLKGHVSISSVFPESPFNRIFNIPLSCKRDCLRVSFAFVVNALIPGSPKPVVAVAACAIDLHHFLSFLGQEKPGCTYVMTLLFSQLHIVMKGVLSRY